MAAEHDNSFMQFVRSQSKQTRDVLLSLPFSAQQQAFFEDQTEQSIAAQKAIEAADTMPFELYRQLYVAPERLIVGSAQAMAA
jgi:glutamate--cysteine ligase